MLRMRVGVLWPVQNRMDWRKRPPRLHAGVRRYASRHLRHCARPQLKGKAKGRPHLVRQASRRSRSYRARKRAKRLSARAGRVGGASACSAGIEPCDAKSLARDGSTGDNRFICSGCDMAEIEPAGCPALRLKRLRELRGRAKLADEDMVRLQRESLLDPMAPTASVETLLHAFLPHKYVDHTHAEAVLSLVDQPSAEAICTEVYDGRVGVVGYVMPGFSLAQAAAAVYEAKPDVEGLILLKHGIFAFGGNAKESYERMIALVTRAEDYLKKHRKAVFATARLPQAIAPLETVAPVLRGACSIKDDRIEGAWRRLVVECRADDTILNFVNGAALARYGRAGVVTPDHVILTKPWPLIVAAPQDGREAEFKDAIRAAASAFMEEYRAYFARHNARSGGGKTMADPLPRVALVPGLGLFGLGRSKKEARIAADLATSAITTITNAEAIGQFEPVS